MFFILGIIFFSITLFAYSTIPFFSGPVNDPANVISSRLKGKLERLSKLLRKETGFDMVFLTTVSLPDSINIDGYADSVFKKWEIGKSSGEQGILMVLAVKNRASCIHVGKGSGNYLPDSVCRRIIESIMLPAMAVGDYDGSFAKSANVITQRIALEFLLDINLLAKKMNRELSQDYLHVPPPAPKEVHPEVYYTRSFSGSPEMGLILFGIIILIAWLLMRKGLNQKITNRGGYSCRAYMFGGGSSSSGGFSGGYSSGSGFSGFGGGSSGGGGASGGW